MSETSANKHLLIYADDDEDDLMLVKEALTNYNDDIDVCLFEVCSQAYDFLLDLEKNEVSPCLIILDINMPGMGGRELLPLLRARPFYRQVPVIIFTTSSMQHDHQFALQYNAGFITKPLAYRQMTSIAEQFLTFCKRDVREEAGR